MNVKGSLLIGFVIALLVFCSFGTAKVLTQFKMFNVQYWKKEVIEEKNKRIQVLNRLEELDEDGIYSQNELVKLQEGLYISTIGFNYMDKDKGDLPAYDVPLSPGDGLMGSLNLEYRNLWNSEKIKDLLSRIKEASSAGKSVKTTDELGRAVDKRIQEIRAVFTDSERHRDDLQKARFQTNQSKWMASSIGGFIGGGFIFLIILLLSEVAFGKMTLEEFLLHS